MLVRNYKNKTTEPVRRTSSSFQTPILILFDTNRVTMVPENKRLSLPIVPNSY